MPKKSGKKRRYSRGFVVIPIKFQLAPSTLAAGAVFVVNMQGTPFARDLYCISADLRYSLRGGTANEGPLFFGITHGDYSVTEVKEALEAVPIGDGNQITKEQARRLVRKVGVFSGSNVTEKINNGLPVKTNIGFTIQVSQDLNLYVQNDFGSALTGGQAIEVSGNLYGRWL